MEQQSHQKLKAEVTINKKPILKIGFFLFGVLFFGIYSYVLIEVLHYQCPIEKLFHLYCPGCGGTRMIKSLFHGDFYQAFRWNPLLFILLFLLIFAMIGEVIYYKKKKEWYFPSMKFWIGLIILLLVYMVLRNLGPFSYLIPTEV